MLHYLMLYNRYLNIFGIIGILAIAFLFSHDKRAINFRTVLYGLLMQFAIGFAMLKTASGTFLVGKVAEGFSKLYDFALIGIEMVFGKLADPSGPWQFIFAVRVLPIIIFFGALMSMLFYLGIIQRVVALVNKVVRPILGTSGAETVCAISNSFLGQTEAPLVIRNYLQGMTKSEMLVVMVSGMGTVSGGILLVFKEMGVPIMHLLSASVMAIPATIVLAKILYPETEKTQTGEDIELSVDRSSSSNILEAVSNGTSDGLLLALNVGAMLIAFLAMIGLLNSFIMSSCSALNVVLNYLHTYLYFPELQLPLLTLDMIFGIIFAPFGYLLGFNGAEALKAGQLIGTKVAINELVAYDRMVGMALSERAQSVLTYALCGFSNFSCIGIQIGGIGALVPSKKAWLSELGLRALLGAVLANLLSAMVAALLI